MAKHSHRDKILSEGLKVVHAHGYANASVRDICQAAGAPQGSFTNHFASKEAFGLEVIELYFAGSRQVIRSTLLNDDIPPLRRLNRYLDSGQCEDGSDGGIRNGCLYGNFAAEASEHSEAIRLKLLEIFDEVRTSLSYCLKAAIADREISPDLDPDEIAAFIVSSLQGANLLAKAERDSRPLRRFRDVLFASVLRPRLGAASYS